MFHVGGHQGSRGRSTAFSKCKTYQNILNNTDWKRALRCGIQFCTLSCILFIVGVVLTWLGIHDIFGETVPITGPILLTVGALFLILASRQFFLAHARKKRKAALKAEESKKTVVVDADDGNGASTIVMDHTGEKSGLHDDENHMDDVVNDCKNTCSPSLEPGTYIWPSLPYQPSPFACISMMLGKDPSSLFAPPPHSRQGFTCAYSPGTTSTSLSPSRPDNGVSPTSHTTESSLQQLVLSPTAAIAGHLSFQPGPISTPATIAVVEAEAAVASLPPTDSTPPEATAVATTAPANIPTPEKTSPAHISSTNHDDHNHTSSIKPPAPRSPKGLPAMVASNGIHNFPNRTAIMMLKTLEIQETI